MSDVSKEAPSVTGEAASERQRLFVVYNPNALDDFTEARQAVAEACERHGWHEPTWVETTPEDTGTKQAREAVEAGADVVCCVGGDGTVRAVATGLVGTDVPLGLLPAGTGNLLARNLNLPISSLEEAMETVVTGHDRRIDVGLVRTGEHAFVDLATGDTPADDEEIFLVMAGFGLDGEIMAGANENIKKVVGWPAYLLSAAKTVTGRGFSVAVESVDPTPGGSGRIRRHARTVVIGNCGMLQGGVELMPDAVVDDGLLDGVVLAPKGAFGWLSVLADVVTRHRRGHKRLDRVRAPAIRLNAQRPVEAEIDGDPIGERCSMAIRVLPRSLGVRVG
jgi:diacylglycerol kinase family enzyme